jgi:hypothetical protein
MAHRVHAAVNSMQPPRVEPTRDGGAANAARPKLVGGDHSVLARREFGYERIGSGAFLPHMVHNATGVEIRPLPSPGNLRLWRWSLA